MVLRARLKIEKRLEAEDFGWAKAAKSEHPRSGL